MSRNHNTASPANVSIPRAEITGNTDLSLIQRVQQHDPDALAELYDRYSTRVYSLALFVTCNARLAEEATQDAFMKLWTRAETYQDRQDRFLTWLLVVTRHCAIDLTRREFRKSHFSLDEDDFERVSDPHAEAQERWHDIQLLLEHLPPEQHQVIMLSFYHGLSQTEIAHHLGIPLGTIKTRARSGLNKLRQAFSQ